MYNPITFNNPNPTKPTLSGFRLLRDSVDDILSIELMKFIVGGASFRSSQLFTAYFEVILL